METTVVTIGILILIFLVFNQREEIKRLRNGLGRTFDQLSDIKELIEEIRTNQSISTSLPPSHFEEKEILEEKATPDDPWNSYPQEEHTPTMPLVEPLETVDAQAIPPPLPETAIDKQEEKELVPSEPTLSWFEQFKQKNPDIEKFIGENLINKIGIIILVLGISFFVKYAIDKDWINEPARVGIGILCGGILLGVAHRLRLLYKAFSSVLVAGAVSTFYFTIGIAFHDYGIFSQTTAFVIMVLITIFSVFVSILYNRQELAVLSVIGGFAVPFMVSTGESNYHVLFTYLLILNTGMLSISYFKRWILVNFASFLLTVVLFAGWYTTKDNTLPLVFNHAFIYSSLFFLLFSIAFVLNNVVRKNKFSNYEISALIANTAVYYAVGNHICHQVYPQYVGLYTISVGLYNILFAFIIYKKYKFDKNIIYVLIGLALTLATITIPVQFEGNYITIFWACEAVLLFWLTKKSQLRGFTFAGVIIQWLAIGSLFMDLTLYLDNAVSYTFGFNLVFLTGLLIIGSLVSTYKLFKSHDYSYEILGIELNQVFYRKLVLDCALILGYVLPMIEIAYQAEASLSNGGTIYACLYLYHMLYTSALVFFIRRQENLKLLKWSTVVMIVNIVLYIVIAYRIPIMEKEEMLYLAEFSTPYGMIIHYIALIGLIYQTWLFIKGSIHENLNFKNKFTPWFVGFFIVYLLSTEVNIAFLAYDYSFESFWQTKNFVIKVIFPILWGAISFVFLILGIRHNVKIIRVIALSLLGLTILKLFVYDIQSVSETGKIVAFILLGILILTISFVYQKIKKLIVDQDEKTTD